MHRHSLSCIVDIACTGSSTSTRRCASTVAKRTPPSPLRLPKQKYDNLERTAKGFVAALSKKEGKPGWRHETSLDGETRRLTQAVKGYQNPARMPSQEKQQFFAEPVEADWDTELNRLESHGKERLPLGALVELRRGITALYGVIISHTHYYESSSISTLTTTGEMWPSRESDATFVSPGFIPLDLVERCGTEDMAQNDHQVAARVRILKRIRDFQLAVERRAAQLSYALRPLYTQLKNPNPNEWSRTTTVDVARLVDPKSDDISTMSELIAQRHLFEKSKYFEAEQMRFLSSKMFWVRPQRHVEDIETVERMVMRKDPRLDAFVRKAKEIIISARQRKPKSRTEPIAYEQDSRFQFDADDLTVIRFFVNSIRPRRFIQVDPYLYSQSVIIKQLGLYPDREVNGDLIHQFLIELGILPPWEDRITRSRALWDSADETLLKLETLPDALIASTSRSSPTQTAPLGPEDFYSHDIVDSLRHDFGDMPVYVVDDVGAEELDDGVSVERIPSEPENNWLHVHIADPTSVLPPTHSFSHRAFEQIQSLYFVDRTIPLLPHVDVMNNLSLGSAQGRPQLVMTFSAKVDSEGNVLNYKVRPGIVNNIHILHYDDVDAAVGLPRSNLKMPFEPKEASIPPTPPSHISQAIVDDILLARSITKALLRARIRKGYHAFTSPAVTVSIKPRPLPDVPPASSTPYAWSGFPELSYKVSDYRTHETGSRGIIAESMRMANSIASLFFRDRGIPALRRIVPLPTARVEGGFEKMLQARDEHGFVDQFETLDLGLLYGPAQYGIMPGPHGVLGIAADEGYMRITSPLRRFSDMLIHWQIKHALLNPSAPSCRMFSDEWLLDFAKHSGSLEEKHKRIAAVQNTYWAYQYISRWQTERQHGLRDGPDPLDNLVARIKETSLMNRRKQYAQQPVLLPTLGLNATLVGLRGLEETQPVGSFVDVKIDFIQLGLMPLLDVVRK